MIWSGYGINSHTVPIGLIYSLTIIGCALLLPAAVGLRSLPRPLARLAETISAQSYALYLVHLTLLQDVAQKLFAYKVLPLWACIVLAIGGPFVIAWLSVRLIETPILRRRPVHPAPERAGLPADGAADRPQAPLERPAADFRDVA